MTAMTKAGAPVKVAVLTVSDSRTPEMDRSGDTIVFLLPGSPGACRLGMDQIILPQLDLQHRPCNLVELLPRVRREQEPHDGA